MFIPSENQTYIKEVCLKQAVTIYIPAIHNMEDIVDIAKKFEAFFYTPVKALSETT